MTTAEIRYEQLNPVPGRPLHVASADIFIFHMSKAFGKFPVELSTEHIERLEGMDATYAAPSPFRELIVAIKRLGSIRVWAEYDDSNQQTLPGAQSPES